MIQTDNTTLAIAQAMIALRDENKALKAEVEKWKKMFYDLCDKHASISVDTKVLVIPPYTKDGGIKAKGGKDEKEE